MVILLTLSKKFDHKDSEICELWKMRNHIYDMKNFLSHIKSDIVTCLIFTFTKMNELI